MIAAIVKLTKEFKTGQEVFNISVKGDGTTVSNIARIVSNVMGLQDVEFKYTGGDRGWKGDVPYFKYDISKVLANWMGTKIYI